MHYRANDNKIHSLIRTQHKNNETARHFFNVSHPPANNANNAFK